jgi:hypothetical protein
VYATTPMISQGDIAFITCLGNKDHFYFCRAAQGGQGK